MKKIEWYQIVRSYDKRLSFKSFKNLFFNDLDKFEINFNSKYSLKEYFNEFKDLGDLRLGYFYLHQFKKVDEDLIKIFNYYISKEKYFKSSLLEDFIMLYFKYNNINSIFKSLDILKEHHYKQNIISNLIWVAQRGLTQRNGFKTDFNYKLIQKGYKWCVMHYFNPYMYLPYPINIIYKPYFIEYANNHYSKIEGKKLKEKFLRAFK